MRTDEETTIVGTSDLLSELIPLLFVRKDQIRRIAIFHMIYPLGGYKYRFSTEFALNPKEFIGYLQQAISLMILRWRCDYVFALSNTFGFLVGKGIDSKRIVTFDQGVARDLVDGCTNEASAYDACWIGRYSPRKGCEDLIHIWKLVNKERPSANLAIMGSASDSERIRALVAQNGLGECVKLLGFVSERVKFQIFAQSKVFPFPSYYEGWPVAVCEALACGLPAVLYDLPFNDVFDAGVVKVPVEDVGAFAKAILTLLENDEKRQELSAAAKAASTRFDWNKVGHRFMNIFGRP